MCRAGGRRCPSSKPRTKEQRELYNAKRREKYAQKKRNSIHKIPIEKSFLSPKDYSFPTQKTYARKKDFEQSTIKNKEIISKLTEKEREAINDYIGYEYFTEMNKNLREFGHVKEVEKELESLDKDKEEYEYRRKQRIISLVDDLDETLKNNATDEIGFVYRGIKGEAGEKILANNVGDVLDFNSFTSTSTDPFVAAGFADRNHRVIFEMRTNKGLSISGDEDEVIIPRNTRWRIVGRRTAEVECYDIDKFAMKEFTFIQLIDENLIQQNENQVDNDHKKKHRHFIPYQNVKDVFAKNKKLLTEQDEIFSTMKPEQREAFTNYTSVLYHFKLNEHLRKNGSLSELRNDESTEGDRIFNDKIIKISTEMDSYFKDMGNQGEKIVYRGIKKNAAEELAHLKKGDNISFSSYLSTSNSLEVANRFTDIENNSVDTILEMRTDKALYIAGQEEENILPRNTNWIIIGEKIIDFEVEDNNGDIVKSKKRIIQLVQDDLSS